MILETIVATSIYSGAIAYLASDNPEQAMARESQPRVEMKATLASSDLNTPARLRSFTTYASGRIRYTDQFPSKHESMRAKEDGNFEDWLSKRDFWPARYDNITWNPIIGRRSVNDV